MRGRSCRALSERAVERGRRIGAVEPFTVPEEEVVWREAIRARCAVGRAGGAGARRPVGRRPYERVRPDRLGDDERPRRLPPERDSRQRRLRRTGSPRMGCRSRHRGRRGAGRRARLRLRHSRGCAGPGAARRPPASELARPRQRGLESNGVDEPDTAVGGERVRGSRRRLVDDPREALRSALVAEAHIHASEPTRRRARAQRDPPRRHLLQPPPGAPPVSLTSRYRGNRASLFRLCADSVPVSATALWLRAPLGLARHGGERLGEREAPRQQRAPRDRALAAKVAERPRDRRATAIPPAAITGSRGGSTSRAVEVGTCERAVARRARHEEPADPGVGARLARSAAVVPDDVSSPRRRPRPSRTSIATTSASPKRSTAVARKPGASAAVPTITRSAPAASAALDRVAASDSRRRPGSGARRRPRPARRAPVTGLPLNAPSRSTRWSRARALAAEPPRELDGVAAFDRDGVTAPLREPYDASFEHVDRGYHLEARVLAR